MQAPARSDHNSAEVQLERRDGVAVVTLSAPERRNALTPEMALALSGVLRSIDDDETTAAVVIRGAGGYFCAGGDRKTLESAAQDPASDRAFRAMDAIYQSFVVLGQLSVPTIAAVRGGAVGAGLNLALATDVRIIGRSALLESGFLRIGAHPGGGHFQLLAGAGGRELAAAMTLLGERIDGARAQSLGLALEAVDDEDVDGRALRLAAAAGDPSLTRLATESFREQLNGSQLPARLLVRAEQAAQMWSLRRSADRLGSGPTGPQ